MCIRRIYYSLFILIPISTFIQPISTCPIPFDIQSKCRCAIMKNGRVYIYCARKQLTDVPRFNNSNIVFDELVLSGNHISVVPKNAFNGLKLRKLEFQSNPIESIESKAFADLSNYLEELIFSTTVFSAQLNFHTFRQILGELPNLKRLFLRSFDLSTSFAVTGGTSVSPSRKLTHLSLQACAISRIDNLDAFVHLFPNLERLDLSENRLEYFDIPLVLSLKKLKSLNLSKNKIRHLNIHRSISLSTFHPSNSLTELDLSYNGIETIDEHIFELISSQLESLNLRNNELVTEKHLTFLIHLYHLREFYFDYNRLEAINQLYLPLNLKVLSLKNNRLSHINLSILARLGHLEKLYLSSNKLTQWSSTVNNMFPSLEVLELDRNQLSLISALNAPKLKQLNLDGNLLGKQLDKKTFANIPLLERLQLRDNQIETVDQQLLRNTRLQSLDLANNSLTAVPLLINLNDTLQSLSLRRNQICTIDQAVVNYYQTLQTLEFDQNPLHCDCHFGRDVHELFRSKTKITGQCQSPPDRRNVHLVDLPNEQLQCSTITLPQCTHLIKTELETTTTTTTTTTTITTTTMLKTTAQQVIEELIEDTRDQHSESATSATAEDVALEKIRISDLLITPSTDRSRLIIQWELYPLLNDGSSNDDFRRMYFRNHELHGFKVSSNSPVYKMSELLDVLRRNYTIDYVQRGEICLFLLRKADYEKFCKQVQFPALDVPVQAVKSSLINDSKQVWYMNEPAKSILIGSMFGFVFVFILLTVAILLVTRCPQLLVCHKHSSKYHQTNDSKSETLLVRPTPTNTIPWSSPPASLTLSQQQQAPPYYHRQQHYPRPPSYQPSLSTQCTCPTHCHSSGSSSTDASSSLNHAPNYHIYQEILNDDFHPQTLSSGYRNCRPLHVDTNSPPTSTSTNATTITNPEQCQLCSLSVLV